MNVAKERKRCSKCGKLKAISEYSITNPRGDRRPSCKACQAEFAKKKYWANAKGYNKTDRKTHIVKNFDAIIDEMIRLRINVDELLNRRGEE